MPRNKINFEFTKTDDRRNKVYMKKAYATVLMPPIPSFAPVSCTVDRIDSSFQKHLQQLVNGLAGAKLTVDVASGHRQNSDWLVCFVAKFKATKPSLIVTDEGAKSAYPHSNLLFKAIDEARALTLKQEEHRLEQQKAINGAAAAMKWKRSQIIEEARKNTRLAQRLAALVAEFEAEYRVLSTNADIRDSLKKSMMAENQAQLPEERQDPKQHKFNLGAFNLVGKYLDKYLEQHPPNALPGRFPTSGKSATEWLREQEEKKEE